MKELSRTREWPTRLSLIVILLRYDVLGTIDVNLNELEYLAARLNPFECRRLIAALHYITYDLPNNLAAAGKSQILCWNNLPVDNVEILRERIEQGFQKIKTIHGKIERVRQSMDNMSLGLCSNARRAFSTSFVKEERNVDDDIPCIRHLLHWNSSPAEGKGNTHEILTHRLRQINRNDLADWLGKSSFVQIGKDLDRALVNTFDELVKEETELPHPVTLESLKRYEEEDPWLQIDVILMATLLGLLGTLLTLICYTVLQKIRQHFRKTKYKKLKQQENEDEEYKVRKERRKNKYTTEASSVTTDYIHPDSESDTDAD